MSVGVDSGDGEREAPQRQGSRATQNGALELWPVWTDEGRCFSPRSSILGGSDSMRLQRTSALPVGDAVPRWQQFLGETLLARPSLRQRMIWDMGALCFVGWDILIVPLRVFGIGEQGAAFILAWVATIFWTLDIPATFLGAHWDGVPEAAQGRLEARFWDVAKQYLKSWFVLDVVTVATDWVTIAETTWGFTQGPDYVILGKWLRTLRFVRLLRVLKANELLQEMMTYIRSEVVLTAFGIGKLMAAIVIINHFIACAWYGLGNMDSAGPKTWVIAYGINAEALAYRYATSLHWSLTQFTPASMEVTPTNTLERAFSVCVLLFALVIFSSFVSSITNAMTQLQRLNSEKRMQHATLRRYMREHQISASLMGRIWACVNQRTRTKVQLTHEKDVTMLSLLPKNLRAGIHQQVFAPAIMKHPFFFHYAHANPWVMNQFYREALDELSVTEGQELFSKGEVAERMFFVRTGELRYSCRAVHRDPAAFEAVGDGRWLCEPVLWVKWLHRGKLYAAGHCELIGIRARDFQTIAGQYLHEHPEPARYAGIFAGYFTEIPLNSDGTIEYMPPTLTDIWADTKDLRLMVSAAFEEELEEEKVAERRTSLTKSILPSGGGGFSAF